jgi:hypothetical protein
MIRTIISMKPDDKRWLEQRARLENTSAAGLIRTLIDRYRRDVETAAGPDDDLLGTTSGLWHEGNGLEYQRKIRSEW